MVVMQRSPKDLGSHPRYRDGVRLAIPIGVAAIAFGLSFGVLARAAGMSRIAAVLMSATTFAGSAQTAAVSILGAGGGLVAAITTAVLLNLRYGPIGLSAAPALSGPWWRRLLLAQLVVDESWALSQRDNGRIEPHLLIGVGVTLYVGWVAGTAIGATVGALLGDPQRLGLDAMFPAIFLALLVPQIRSRSRLVAALGGAGIALVLLPVASAGVPILVASLACLAGLWSTGRRQP
jgi:4-azaleucine resistance transporter AzlC